MVKRKINSIAVATPMRIHLPLPPRTVGIGPRKMTPIELLSCSRSFPLDFMLSTTIRAPSTVITSPKPRRRVDTSIRSPSILGKELHLKSYSIYTAQRDVFPMYSLTSHSVTETLSTSTVKSECSLAFLISSSETGGLV